MENTIMNTEGFAALNATVFETVAEIGRGYTYGGQPGSAVRLFQNTLNLFEPGVAPFVVPAEARLKLLVAYARSLITNLFVNHSGEETLTVILAEARQLAESGSDRLLLADVLNLQAQAEYFITIFSGAVVDKEKSKYGQTFANQQAALTIREEEGDLHGICESNFFLGLVRERWQERDLAQAHYNRARERALQHNFYFEVAETSRHLAGIALAENDLDRALENALRELHGREQAGFKPYLPLDHLMLCDIYKLKGDRENALTHANAALQLADEMDYAGAKVLARLRLGDIELQWGTAEKAQVEYSLALEMAKNLGQTLLLNYANQRMTQANVKLNS